MIKQLRIVILTKHCIQNDKWCETFRSMLSNYFCKKQVLRATFGEIWCIQIKIYPKHDIELKYGECHLKNKISAHRLGLVVQLS